MGMAASQARYLALVARKSNCEYEGQQINQARTVLSNQSANLFNQMLGLKVPVPPSTSDFTRTVYTYKDGVGKDTKLENWQQLSTPDPEYNYVVTRSYSTKRYTGAIKKMNDPQVQFTDGITLRSDIETARIEVARTKADYEAAIASRDAAKTSLDSIQKQINNIKTEAAKLDSYKTELADVTKSEFDAANDKYTVTHGGGSLTLTGFEKFSTTEQDAIKNLGSIKALIANGAISEDDLKGMYFSSAVTGYTFAKGSELNSLTIASGLAGDTGLTDTSLNTYKDTDINTKATSYQTTLTPLLTLLNVAQNGYDSAKEACETTQADYEAAVEYYDGLGHPSYVGNCDLTPLADLDKDQLAELQQIVNDMKEQGIESKILDCFEYDENGKISSYNGGVYSFKLNGIVYYTSYDDVEASYSSGTGPNNIDGQVKLPYYNASYVDTKIEETEKALVETDGNGRFTSIRFEDDSIVYTLEMGTETDDVAYKDAMNQYYYDNAVYDKMIRDINAKTSIIQQEDQQLELRLKQLDTEQKALSTEMEAVKKVTNDNIEAGFKTFNG